MEFYLIQHVFKPTFSYKRTQLQFVKNKFNINVNPRKELFEAYQRPEEVAIESSQIGEELTAPYQPTMLKTISRIFFNG